ncbi:hypothetical protein Hanom_Chr16g01466491 [Helianthus anomalus]
MQTSLYCHKNTNTIVITHQHLATIYHHHHHLHLLSLTNQPLRPPRLSPATTISLIGSTNRQVALLRPQPPRLLFDLLHSHHNAP